MPRKGEGIYGGNGGGVNIPSGEGKRRSKPIMEKIHMLADARGGHYLIKKWDELPDESKADSYSSNS